MATEFADGICKHGVKSWASEISNPDTIFERRPPSTYPSNRSCGDRWSKMGSRHYYERKAKKKSTTPACRENSARVTTPSSTVARTEPSSKCHSSRKKDKLLQRIMDLERLVETMIRNRRTTNHTKAADEDVRETIEHSPELDERAGGGEAAEPNQLDANAKMSPKMDRRAGRETQTLNSEEQSRRTSVSDRLHAWLAKTHS